jgi:hypothetical protein
VFAPPGDDDTSTWAQRVAAQVVRCYHLGGAMWSALRPGGSGLGGMRALVNSSAGHGVGDVMMKQMAVTFDSLFPELDLLQADVPVGGGVPCGDLQQPPGQAPLALMKELQGEAQGWPPLAAAKQCVAALAAQGGPLASVVPAGAIRPYITLADVEVIACHWRKWRGAGGGGVRVLRLHPDVVVADAPGTGAGLGAAASAPAPHLRQSAALARHASPLGVV